MNNLDLLKEIVRRSPPTPAMQKKIEDQIQKAVSTALLLLDLDVAQTFGATGVPAIAAHIGVMGQPDLKKLLKRWDPHRKVARETTITEMREIAVALLNAEVLPTPRPQPTRHRRAA